MFVGLSDLAETSFLMTLPMKINDVPMSWRSFFHIFWHVFLTRFRDAFREAFWDHLGSNWGPFSEHFGATNQKKRSEHQCKNKQKKVTRLITTYHEES